MKPAARLRSVFFFALIGLLSFGCLFSGGEPAIGDVVTAKSLDAAAKPVNPTSTYSSDDPIYISVQANDLVVGSVVEVKYMLAGAEYYKSSQTADQAGSGYYGFQLTATSGHTPGDYTAEVYLDGKLTKTVTFTVVASGPPTVVDAVSAKSVDADGKPTEPATTFGSTDTIYISVQVKNVLVGSKVRVVFSFNGATNETTSTADKPGSGYYTFSMSPSAGGNASGDYKADVYLDDTLVKTVTFTVE